MAITNRSLEKAKLLDNMWQSGKTIGEINQEFQLIKVLPTELKDVNKDSKLDFSRRISGLNNIRIPRLLLKGFYISAEGQEYKHSMAYTTFKYLTR